MKTENGIAEGQDEMLFRRALLLETLDEASFRVQAFYNSLHSKEGVEPSTVHRRALVLRQSLAALNKSLEFVLGEDPGL